MSTTSDRGKSFFADKRVLVTGCCGTVGQELVRLLLTEYEVGELVGLDNNESELFYLDQIHHGNSAYFYLTDVRDPQQISARCDGVDVVVHTAAFKHVFFCEQSPFEAVQTNILGVHNVIGAALGARVGVVIFTSSDKAVNPTSVMGTSKLMGERLMTAGNSNQRNRGTIFASTRFGNVLGSRGSVIPLFREQIRRGGAVTLTDPAMTRFIMSVREAARLVLDSAVLARGGEVFVTKMPAIRIKDLVEIMIEELAPGYGHRPQDIEVKVTGVKPGEKMFEELMNQEETRRALELQRYYAILPAFTSLYLNVDYSYEKEQRSVERPYHSANQDPLDREVFRRLLRDQGLIGPAAQTDDVPARRFWPGE